MNRHLLVAAVALSFACGPQWEPSEDGTSESTGALTTPPGVPVTPYPTPPVGNHNPCDAHLTRVADETLTMGKGVQERTDQSPSATYPAGGPNDACERYVVDVVVPSTSTGYSTSSPELGISFGDFGFQGTENAIDPVFPYPDTSSAAHCTSYHAHLDFYRKPQGATAFGSFKFYDLVGYVLPSGHCNLQDVNKGVKGSQVASVVPPASGTDTYRMVMTGDVDGHQTVVGVRIEHE